MGPLCRLCVAESRYYDGGTARCRTCAATGGGAAGLYVLTILLALAGLAAVAAGARVLLRARAAQALARLSQLELRASMKLLLGFYQVATVLPVAYSVRLPEQYHEAMRAFTWVNLGWLHGLAGSNACIGSFLARLLVQTLLLPTVALTVLLGGGAFVWRHRTREHRLGHLLELSLLFVFAVVPTVAHEIFSAFACEGFGFDDADSVETASFDISEHYYLRADYAVRCDSSDPQYEAIRSVALLLVLLWPVGAPALFGTILRTSRRDQGRRRAAGFLMREYTAESFWWEVPLLLKKLILTGFLLLIPEDVVFLRLVAALLVVLAYLVLVLIRRPYRSPETAALALGINVALACLFFSALLLHVANESTTQQRLILFGSDNIFSLTVLLLLVNFGVLAGTAAFLSHQARTLAQRTQLRRLRYLDGVQVATPKLSADHHVFLSHTWGTGQDQMRVVKQRLDELLPGLCVFLDVDEPNFDISDLEGYVDRSQVVVVFCSAGYAKSKNCIRELRQAVSTGKPLVALLETDVKHGGLTVEEMRTQLVDTDLAALGLPTAPSGQELAAALFATAPIEWTRLGPMQDVTLRLIAQRLLPADSGRTCVHDELSRRRSNLPPLRTACHLFCSQHNPGVQDLAAEVKEARQLPLRWTDQSPDSCAAMLVYLTARTWQGGEALILDVELAMERGVPLVLAHEMPGLGQEERSAIEFDMLIKETPGKLRDRGLYGTVAVPLKGGEWRAASMALLEATIAEASRRATTEGPRRGWLQQLVGCMKAHRAHATVFLREHQAEQELAAVDARSYRA